MKIYTIGFTKKNAERFFNLLEENNIRHLVDIRLNNASQLAGFAKGNDLKFFLKAILGISYTHDVRLSPTKELLDSYKNGVVNWKEYEVQFVKILNERRIEVVLINEYYEQLEGVCFLCSEEKADQCHRRLVAEYFREIIADIEIVHI